METQTKDRRTAVEFATEMRVHIAINVRDLARSLDFYKALFNQEPTKLRDGYAKFEVAEPPVNFTLNEHGDIPAGPATLNHMGIQVKSTSEVARARKRLQERGLLTVDEEDTTCCYAVQDKVWAQDPDGHKWEFFVVVAADAPKSEKANPALGCACGSAK